MFSLHKIITLNLRSSLHNGRKPIKRAKTKFSRTTDKSKMLRCSITATPIVQEREEANDGRNPSQYHC